MLRRVGSTNGENEQFPAWVEEAAYSFLASFGIRGADVPELYQSILLVAVRRNVAITKPWLREVARKLAANHRRLWRQSREVLVDSHALGNEFIDADAALGAGSPDLESLIDLRRALAKMDPTDAEMVVRHVVVGETAESLAPLCGLSTSGAHARIKSRLAQLSMTYEDEGHEGATQTEVLE